MPPKPSQPPFWQDEIETLPAIKKLPGILIFTFLIYRIVFLIFILALSFYLFYQLSPWFGWIWLVVFFIPFIWGLYLRKRTKQSIREINDIQHNAREITGAHVIGSAVHVAGHPMLERDQPVVLALTPDTFRIYSYTDSRPIDTITIRRLTAIHTVNYDDEHVPHLDVIDSAAQALQITLNEQDVSFTCLFRRMRKVRPIDWYHELQKAKWRQIHP